MRRNFAARSWVAPVARLLVGVLLFVSAGPLIHSDPGHDADCEPALILHDESQHRFTARPSGDDADTVPGHHCVGCHFTRLMRGAVTRVVTGAVPVPRTIPTLDPNGRVAGDPRDRPLPARAPPTASML